MPNYLYFSKNATAGGIGGIEKGNSMLPQSPDAVKSMKHHTYGNVTHLANTVFKLGEKGSSTRPVGAVQDFDLLKKKCLSRGILFKDPEFPAIDSSIYGEKHVEKDIEWKRPPAIVNDPQLFVKGGSRFDVKQGQFGDCWLLAAIANLTLHEELLYQVIPKGQSFEKGNYAGIFLFKFWQYGRWVDVVIDDCLPFCDGAWMGVHSGEPNEFWSALLEKAYAKLHGSYIALEGGDTGDAMEDFTGGVAEIYLRDTIPDDLFDVLLKSHEKNSLLGCSFKTQDEEGNEDEEDNEDNEDEEDNEDNDDENGDEDNDDSEGTEDNKVNEDVVDEKDDKDDIVSDAENDEVNENPTKDYDLKGLIVGHAYSITKVMYLESKMQSKKKIPLLRVRNPWGTEDEWKGPWSDKSPEWTSFSDQEREQLGLKFEDDGEFWISFDDLKQRLADLEICHLNLNSLTDSTEKKEWEISAFEGEWVRGATAGGCSDKTVSDKFHHNPQYRITLKEEGLVIVALMQKNRRNQGLKGVDFLNIGFSIVPLKENSGKKLPKPLDLSFFEDSDNEELDIDSWKTKLAPQSQQYNTHRQVSCHVKLSSGTYCIIPSTYEPDLEGEYLLRVFSEKLHTMEEYNEQVDVDEVDKLVPTKLMNKKKLDYFRLLSGNDFELDWIELKKVVDFEMHEVLHNDGFSKHVCRSLVALLDADRSGKVGFHEYQRFWKDIKKLKDIFQEITYPTSDPKGYLSTFDLRKALNQAGYHLNNRTLHRLVRRYGTEDKTITFEDFIMCAVRLRAMLGTFKEHCNPNQKDIAALTLDEWLDTTLNL